MKKVLIVGMGEVGKSIYDLYKDYKDIYKVYIKDMYAPKELLRPYTPIRDGTKVDIMHVCIPYTDLFFKEMLYNISSYSPELTIINSTVPPYTTLNVYMKTGVNIVHSPIMGVHPNLTRSIKTFKKIVGGVDSVSSNKAIEHFNSLGIECKEYENSTASELAKLLSTTYYAWNIIYMKNAYKLCEDLGVDFENVYKDTNIIYNEGYEKMGMPHVRRPILKFVPGTIGGHCLRPNLKILKTFFPLAKVIQDMDDSLSVKEESD